MSNHTELQFWFLLRRRRVLADDEIVEPHELPQSADDIAPLPLLEQAIGYPENPPEDRRLFRYNIAAEQREQDLSSLLADAWAQVAQQYARCEVHHKQAPPQYENRAESLLLGVALLVVSEDLQALPLSLPMRETLEGEIVADCVYQPAKKLFTAVPQCLPQATVTAYAYQAKPKLRQAETHLAKITHWQVQLDQVDAPCLLELEAGEDDNHPVFNVFGVAAPGELFADAQAQAQLQHLAVFDERSHGYSSLMFLLTPLLMRNWQYAHIETASRRLDENLKRHNQGYKQVSDLELRVLPHEQLEEDLQTMQNLEAQAHYEQGRIMQALRTLEINRNALLNRQQRILTQSLSSQWQFDWLWYDISLTALQRQREGLPPSSAARPELTASFHTAVEDLQNLQTYLQGKLTHLKGSNERWRVALEQQRLELYEKLGHIGHAIILLVALAEMGHVIHNATADKHGIDAAHGAPAEQAGHGWFDMLMSGLHWLDSSTPMHVLAALLQSPTLFVLLVMAITFPALKSWLRYSWRRSKERRHHRRAQREQAKR